VAVHDDLLHVEHLGPDTGQRLQERARDTRPVGARHRDAEGVDVRPVAAVFLSNVPESMSASAGLKRAGRSTGQILRLWLLVMVASGLAAGAGFVLLHGASPALVAGIQTFAAGAIITMLADTMMPEATEHAGRLVGLVTMLGFALAFLLSALG
jgi:ZIP family zinc transporter